MCVEMCDVVRERVSWVGHVVDALALVRVTASLAIPSMVVFGKVRVAVRKKVLTIP